MATITDFDDIPLDDLVIGKGQVRTTEPGSEIDELAASIDAQGLLQPILVCKAQQEGKWEILTGQRRFLAHKRLKKTTIKAAIIDKRLDEKQAKAISITENLIRKKLSRGDLIDGVTYLFNHYGTIKEIVAKTGLPRQKVSDYVKFPRLLPELKDMVRDGEIDVNVALKAQDATIDVEGNPDEDLAIKLAREMEPMSGVQRRKLIEDVAVNPDKDVEDVIESAKSGAKIIQISVTLTQAAHGALQTFARNENSTQDDAAATLIQEALVERGLLG